MSTIVNATITPEGKLSLSEDQYLTGKDNWKFWKIRVIDWLTDKELRHLIHYVMPPTNPVAISQVTATQPAMSQDQINSWTKDSNKVLTAIRRSMKDNILTIVYSANTIKEVWDLLVQHHEITDYMEIGQLLCHFWSYDMPEEMEADAWVREMREIYDAIR